MKTAYLSHSRGNTVKALVFLVILTGCAGGLSYELDVPVTTMPYSLRVLAFDYSNNDGCETFKKFNPDTLIGRELERQKFFNSIFYPQNSSSMHKPSSIRKNDLTLRGTIRVFEATCVPESPNETKEIPGQERQERDYRSDWREEQTSASNDLDPQQRQHGWEWGETRYNGGGAPKESSHEAIPTDESYSFELVKNRVRGKLEITIKILGKRTNKKVYEEVFEGKINKSVLAFFVSPETVDQYVANILMSGIVKDLLEDLAIEFYQHTKTEDFRKTTGLP